MPTKPQQRNTFPVSDKVFKAVYDSPQSLPGKHKWLTAEADVRKIEAVLGMAPKTIGAPLCVSGDRKRCPKCRREINWLDIVSSALGTVHSQPGRVGIAYHLFGFMRVICADKEWMKKERLHEYVTVSSEKGR